MAKIYGLQGVMTGKLANTVMAVRNGEQIARKYQPVVFNPSTPAQVAQRAKLKALSQLSAVVAPAIAMPRIGSVSSRNQFTKINFPSVSYADNTASINIPSIQLTKSVVGLPALAVTNNGGNIDVSLGVAGIDIDRMVYVAITRDNDGSLRFAGSVVVSTPGDDFLFSGVINTGANRDAFVLAYGVRDNTDAARVLFGNLNNPSASEIANLIVTRTLTETDITLTETRGTFATISSQSVLDENREVKKVKKN